MDSGVSHINPFPCGFFYAINMEYLKLKLTPKEYDAIIEILESVQSAWVGSFDEELSKDAKRAIKAFNSAAKRSCTPGILGGNSYA